MAWNPVGKAAVRLEDALALGSKPPPAPRYKPPSPADVDLLSRVMPDVTGMQREASQAPAESPEATALRSLANLGLDSPEKVAAYGQPAYGGGAETAAGGQDAAA